MEAMFYGKHRRPKLDEGKMDEVSKVETAGYIPADRQIEMFIQAGRRLDQARREQFDFAEGEEVPEDAQPDPTRSGAFDLADATQLGRALNAKAKSVIRERADKEVKNPDEGNGKLPVEEK